jgi:hypothetical protein
VTEPSTPSTTRSRTPSSARTPTAKEYLMIASAAQTRTGLSSGQVALIVAGTLAGLLALALLVGGGGGLFALGSAAAI